MISRFSIVNSLNWLANFEFLQIASGVQGGQTGDCIINPRLIGCHPLD
jgi:hypothetical protein